jgi:hypothetical protein
MLAMFHARSVATYADGHADITVTGERGTLTLQVYSHDPLIAIEDPQQGRLRGKALASLIGNGNLRGWCVEKKSTTPSEDTVVWFPPGRQAPGNGYRRKRPLSPPVDSNRSVLIFSLRYTNNLTEEGGLK